MQHLFELKRFDSTTSSLKNDFAKALKVYVDQTPADIKTNSNELSSWLTRPYKAHFEMLVFILYCDGEVVGLAMMTYHQQVQVMAYEYIAIDNAYSSFASYFSYLDLLNSYTAENGYDVLYWIVEINNRNGGKDIDKESVLFKKILCLSQFGKIEAYHMTFPLGLDKDSSFDAVMYIKSNDRIKQISKDKYMKIVESIKEYYAVWYKRFMSNEDYSRYCQILCDVFEKIKRNQASINSVPISYIDCPLLTPGEKTHTVIVPNTNATKKKKWLVPVAILGIVAIASIIAAVCWMIFTKFGIDISSIAIIIANVAAALISAFFLWFIGKKS